MRLLGASGTRLAQIESVDETNAADGNLGAVPKLFALFSEDFFLFARRRKKP